jgi:prolyl oligopeptidase
MTRKYPDARKSSAADMLSGVSFDDPYRWLEEDSQEVRLWQRMQADLAVAHVRGWPHFERLRQLVNRFPNVRDVSAPRYAAGKWFFTRVNRDSSQIQAFVADEAGGPGRVLFDPAEESRERPPFLSWIEPSPDGCTLALGVCRDGSEANTIRLIDVASGQRLASPPSEVLMDNWTGGVQWLRDSSGFFFTAIDGPATAFCQRVYLHKRVPYPTTAPVDVCWTEKRSYRVVTLSSDGRYAVAVERLQNPIPVAVAPIHEGQLRWRPFLTSCEDKVVGHVVGDSYIAITDFRAPRGRLVAIDLDAANPDDPRQWRELVGETHVVLRNSCPVQDVIYLTELEDTYSRIRIVDRSGRAVGAVPLPGYGAVADFPFPMTNLLARAHPKKFIFSFSSLTVSSGVYAHTLGADKLEGVIEPEVRLDAIVEDHSARSSDGSVIPYHEVRRADIVPAHDQPTLLYAYGGFNVPLPPQFPGPMAAFVAAGGTLVVAHIRGGGEFGRQWWEEGRLRNKQNSYDDLYAVTEDLIGRSRCSSRTLALMGGSNGGLMAGVALTQRPELWRVVVPRVPMLDLIGACREPYGRWVVNSEYADIEDPDDVRRLASFSPYHLIRKAVRYPAVFVDAGDTDPRTPAWHARKFVARLQAACGSASILLHVWENVGHGWATNRETAVMEHTEWLAFVIERLGLSGWT